MPNMVQGRCRLRGMTLHKKISNQVFYWMVRLDVMRLDLDEPGGNDCADYRCHHEPEGKREEGVLTLKAGY